MGRRLSGVVLVLLCLCMHRAGSFFFGSSSPKDKDKDKDKDKPVAPMEGTSREAASKPWAVEANENLDEVLKKQKQEIEEDGLEDGEPGSGKGGGKKKINRSRDFIEGSREFDPIVKLPKNRTMRIAFCLTGQLARLELASKLKNIFQTNVQLGHTVHVFTLLDNNIEDVHQTFWNYDYSKNMFARYNSTKMESYFESKKKAYPSLNSARFQYRVRLESPAQPHFQVVGGMIPVETKRIINVGYEREHGLLGAGDGVEPASQRFQNNMRWLGGLRDCVKWVMQAEFESRQFYDVIVRLRDDTLAFGKWKFYRERYLGALTSARVGSFRGVNDHNFVVDRTWGDSLFRGFTEDYYLNATFEKVMWGNPEHRIAQLADALHIPIKNMTICEEPLIPLRGRHNDTHWLLHNQYRDNLLSECANRRQRKRDNCVCPPSWLKTLHYGVVAFDLKSSA